MSLLQEGTHGPGFHPDPYNRRHQRRRRFALVVAGYWNVSGLLGYLVYPDDVIARCEARGFGEAGLATSAPEGGGPRRVRRLLRGLRDEIREGHRLSEEKDRDALFAFYDFLAEHWRQLRTTNPIQSTFRDGAPRTIRSKGCLSNKTALAMVFMLVEQAQRHWCRLDGHALLPNTVHLVRSCTLFAAIGERGWLGQLKLANGLELQ